MKESYGPKYTTEFEITIHENYNKDGDDLFQARLYYTPYGYVKGEGGSLLQAIMSLDDRYMRLRNEAKKPEEYKKKQEEYNREVEESRKQ